MAFTKEGRLRGCNTRRDLRGGPAVKQSNTNASSVAANAPGGAAAQLLPQ